LCCPSATTEHSNDEPHELGLIAGHKLANDGRDLVAFPAGQSLKVPVPHPLVGRSAFIRENLPRLGFHLVDVAPIGNYWPQEVSQRHAERISDLGQGVQLGGHNMAVLQLCHALSLPPPQPLRQFLLAPSLLGSQRSDPIGDSFAVTALHDVHALSVTE